MSLRRRLLGGLLLLLIKPAALLAQPLVCNVNVSVPPAARGEGIGELVGDITLTCTGVAPPAGITSSLTVFLNTNVTSRIIGGASEALLLIGEPGSAVNPGTPQTLGVNVFQGTVSVNQVVFNSVPFQIGPGLVQNKIFRITNIRANSSALGGGPSTVQAFVAAGDPAAIVVNNPVQTVAFNQRGITFDSQCEPAGQASINLRFTEAFPLVFKPHGGPSQNVPGNIYNTETGFTPNPVIAGVGTANSGTELGASLSGIPAGVTLSVPPLITVGGLSITAVTPPGGGAVPVVGGSATIVYEVIATNPNATESVSIPVTVSSLPLPSATVRGNLYPLSTQTAASAVDPLPRFADVSTLSPFGASCTAVPTLSPSGLVVLVFGLLTVGSFALRRRAVQ